MWKIPRQKTTGVRKAICGRWIFSVIMYM